MFTSNAVTPLGIVMQYFKRSKWFWTYIQKPAVLVILQKEHIPRERLFTIEETKDVNCTWMKVKSKGGRLLKSIIFVEHSFRKFTTWCQETSRILLFTNLETCRRRSQIHTAKVWIRRKAEAWRAAVLIGNFLVQGHDLPSNKMMKTIYCQKQVKLACNREITLDRIVLENLKDLNDT